MDQRFKLSRRGFLQGASAISGAAIGTRLAGSSLVGTASAQQAKKAAVVTIFLEGGFNALFSSADSFLPGNKFSVSDTNIASVGNGLFVDKASFGSLDAWSLKHMAAIGNRHGAVDHASAPRLNFLGDNKSYVVQLAAAMGGTAAFKAAALGSLPTANSPSENGVSIQLLRTMGDVNTALGLGPVNFNLPARGISARGVERSRAMSQAAITKNRLSMKPVDDAYATLVDSLGRPPLNIDVTSVAQAYGVSAGAGLDTMAAKLAAAELMIRGQTNVITLADTGWDTHGDPAGTTARRKMGDVIPSLKKFLARLQSEPELAAMNVTLMVHGDFARDLPSSDHAPCLSALVIGTNVKVGTTGKVSAKVTLPESTGASKQMWSYLAECAKVAQNPFGVNPHQLVL